MTELLCPLSFNRSWKKALKINPLISDILKLVCRKLTWSIYYFMESESGIYLTSVIYWCISYLLVLDTDSRMRPLSPPRQKSRLNYNRCLISWWLISGEMKPTPGKQNGAFLNSMYLMPPASMSLKYTKYCSQREIKLIYSGALNSNDTSIMKNKWFPSVKFIPWSALW